MYVGLKGYYRRLSCRLQSLSASLRFLSPLRLLLLLLLFLPLSSTSNTIPYPPCRSRCSSSRYFLVRSKSSRPPNPASRRRLVAGRISLDQCVLSLATDCELYGERVRIKQGKCDGNPQINPNPPIIHQHILHLEISLFCIFSLVKFNERILQRVARLLIPDYLTTHNRAKAGQDELQIFIPS